ncbi:MAG: hypothetical protein ACKOCD_11420 [Nitrospiraceae bacterium]
MKRSEKKAQRDMPKLQKWLEALVSLGKRAIKTRPNLSTDDHFGFMALCFASKQLVHGMSVLRLQEGADSALVARSMLEGLCQLLWAAQEPQQRGLLWRAYSFVVDWRQIQTELAEGKKVPAKLRRKIAQGLKQFGGLFKPRPRPRCLPTGISDPYRDGWSGLSYNRIFNAVKGQLLYTKNYGPFSAWHHWSPEGFAGFLVGTGFRVSFRPTSLGQEAAAISSAFLCLYQTLEVFDWHCNLGISKELAKLKDGYIKDMTK